MDNEKAYNMQSSPQVVKGRYFPLYFDNKKPSQKRIREICKSILNFYLKDKLGINKLKKLNQICFEWKDNQGMHKEMISFNDIEGYLYENRKYDHLHFKLPQVLCGWLDSSIVISPKFHAPSIQNEDESLTFRLPTSLGEKFSLSVQLDREGIAFSSMQLYLQNIIIKTRKKLVYESYNLFENNEVWLGELLQFLNLSIALVENTFHQLYYKAKYDYMNMGWKFDEERLGLTYGRRFKDKFDWIKEITGNALDNAEDAKANVIKLKNIRNHFSHFDPPVMAFSIEDVTNWLNYIDDLAVLLWKIRAKLGSPLSFRLIEMLLTPKVYWYPHDPGRKRTQQNKAIGYTSCTW